MAPSARFRRAHSRGKNCGGNTEIQVVYNSPSLQPHGLGPATRRDWCVGYRLSILGREVVDMRSLLQLNLVGARSSRAAPGRSGPFMRLILFFACLFPSALTSQRCFYTLFFAGLQVEGVALDLLDNVFLLHLALEPA